MRKQLKGSKKSIIKKSNKRAQFFMMAGIIIILVLYTLTINYNWIRETVDLEQLSNFKEKSESYNKESVKVVNYKIYTAPAKCLDLVL